MADPNPTSTSPPETRQDQIERKILKQVEETKTQDTAVPPRWWSAESAMTISSVVLAFGIISVCIAAYLIRSERNPDSVLRVLATILILTFSVFLIVAGYDDQQIAPAMGLLG